MMECATPKSARKASEKDPVTSIEAGEVRELTNADIEASYINNGKLLEESIERIVAIDLTVFIEALPKTHTYLMTGLAATWGVGTAIGALIAWPLIANYSCPQDSTPATCHRSENMGWRYQYITVGGMCLVMAIVRIFIFRMEESPIWLASQGELTKAVANINRIATTNRSDHRLSVDRLAPVAKMQKGKPHFQFDLRRFTGLFKGRKQARSMVCLIVLWMTMGIAYPIYSLFLTYYLQAHGAKLGDGSTYQTYRDYSISATVVIHLK
ncbi:Sugar transporter [Lasiodiplodia theobromae]|uniref:Sugar transporter n=1 Tax=Lasiodiplodia theobromae TaxID=45133 RepID=UPI0015C3324B|nr:Sugar transporter [Lasiodiplodia theobromae]KAF4539073.1 Sugar transporter [Lasiodiplodia theobromae]